MKLESRMEIRVVDDADLSAVDWDGTGIRIYAQQRDRRGELTGRKRVVAEKTPRGAWRDTAGTPLSDATVQAIEEWLDGQEIERRRVRDGSKPMPPKTYWDDELGHYVEPSDPEWNQHRYNARSVGVISKRRG